MWRYELHPPHLLNVATLPCGSQNSWKSNITVGYYQRKLHQMYRICFIEMDLYIIKFGLLCSSACTKQRFVTSITCKNAWRKLRLTLNRMLSRLQLTAARPSEIMRAGGGHFERMLWNYCSFVLGLCGSLHQNILWNCQCNFVHLTAVS